jgi:CO dehydrogenase/acetyl-CoA synthase epsilon subunit
LIRSSPSGSRRLDSIVGTTAERLVRTAKRPVLVVSRDVQDRYGKVAIAADLSSASLPMMRTAIRLAALDHASARSSMQFIHRTTAR